ncbi:BnaA10g28880D [Brassica napus]|uniref:BnaA10g28880D protein n=1 Tax=Brassica napus TaxID=3708 RepID=A0A078JLN3_BRANA|nr:BnaA10g28880D [Brassica napus]
MILEGLVSIHGHGYVHCDMKSDNLLVFPSSTSRYELKVSDFGNCLEVGQVAHSWASDFPWVGTPNYMPPESVRDGVANKTLDLWSVGCLVLEIDIAARLRCGEAPKILQSLPSDAKDFIETCFSRNPEERGSAYELLFHPFLPRPQVEEGEKKTEEKKLNSFLLRLLKLKIRRTTSMKKSTKDSVLVADKESLKLRMNPRFKRTLNKVLSLKNHAFEEIHRLQFSVGSLRV